jgi:hypothetical protein
MRSALAGIANNVVAVKTTAAVVTPDNRSSRKVIELPF